MAPLRQAFSARGSTAAVAGEAGNGSYVEVYVDDVNEDVTVVIVHTYLGQITDVDDNPVQGVFLQADSMPDNAVNAGLPGAEPGQTQEYPTEADGYYPVPVESGLTDRYNVEITSGLNEGAVIFRSFMMTTAY